MDWTQLSLIAAGVALGIVVTVLVNLATQVGFSPSLLIGIAVAGVGIAIAQYAVNERPNHGDSALNGAADRAPNSSSRSPSATPSHRSPHHSTGNSTPQGGATDLPPRSTSPVAAQTQAPVIVTSAPKFLDYTRLASVSSGTSSPNFCASVYVPSSHAALLFFSTKYGSFSTASFDVRATAKRCTTYNAPAADSIRSDVITIRVIDREDNKSSTVHETVPIPPDPTPPA